MSTQRTVAIHQPNFFPWLGWFDKVAKVDVFILLDDVQFPKKGGTWMNRVKVSGNETGQWLTVPIVRGYHGTREVREIEIDGGQNWRQRIGAVLDAEYRPASHFGSVRPLIDELINVETSLIAELNLHVLSRLIEELRLDATEVALASDLSVTETSTERLISLTRAVGGDCYLAGGGAGAYQRDEAFEEAGIGLLKQGFTQTPYPQRGADFTPGLSVIDTLMNCGIEETSSLIRGC